MRKSILTLAAVLLVASLSCERSDDKDKSDVFFIIGDDSEFTFSDIELYDSSTYILYFKTEHGEFKNIKNILRGPFAFMDNGEIIYQGSFVPSYSSNIPVGPFITSPSMYGNYVLRIDEWIPGETDVRNCPKIISVLNEHNLLHSGLSGKVDTIEIIGKQLVFKFTITNHDESDLLILDINKTGLNLFHYFTNGLSIRDLNNNEVFTSNIGHQTPDPWNSWRIDWLTQIKSSESIQFTINDSIITTLNQGEYLAIFEFPGLSNQVTKDQLFQDGIRIWLGDIRLIKKIIFQYNSSLKF